MSQRVDTRILLGWPVVAAILALPLVVYGDNRTSSPAPAGRVAHVIVALADNRYQGIVPVPPAIGNGDDPDRNLYWGTRYGRTDLPDAVSRLGARRPLQARQIPGLGALRIPAPP